MKTRLASRHLIAAPLLVWSMSVTAAGLPAVPTGDGMAALQAFDPAARTVMLGQRPVALLPHAALSLEQQLMQQGRQFGPPFTAKFTVVQDGAGQPVIESIYVVPLRRP